MLVFFIWIVSHLHGSTTGVHSDLEYKLSVWQGQQGRLYSYLYGIGLVCSLLKIIWRPIVISIYVIWILVDSYLNFTINKDLYTELFLFLHLFKWIEFKCQNTREYNSENLLSKALLITGFLIFVSIYTFRTSRCISWSRFILIY